MSYREIKYYLKKQYKATHKFENKKKLFNLQYSFFRNVIEKSFEMLKRRFKFIKLISNFFMTIQMRLIYVLIDLNNFIHTYNDDMNRYQREIQARENEYINAQNEFNITLIDLNFSIMNNKRNRIATKM